MSTPPVDNLEENPSTTGKKIKEIGGSRILPINYAKRNYLFLKVFTLKVDIKNSMYQLTMRFRSEVKIFQSSC